MQGAESMPSINQHHRHPDRLPDFTNMGVWLRAALLVTALSFAATVVISAGWRAVPEAGGMRSPSSVAAVGSVMAFSQAAVRPR